MCIRDRAYNNFNPNSSIYIEGCTFTQNSASQFSGFGGGVLLQNLSGYGPDPNLDINMSNSNVEDNTANEGGGISIFSN